MKTHILLTFSKTAQKALLLTATLLLILSINFLPLYADSDYSFRDESYEEISLPAKPVVRFSAPGALLPEVPFHAPKITMGETHSGLEKIRLIDFEFSGYVYDSTEKDKRMAVYVLDKDGLVIGYHSLKSDETHFQIKINSVINYVQIYVECSKHGLWLKELGIVR